MKSYSSANGKNFPFALAFIVLPLILHKKTRDSFPRDSRPAFHQWCENNAHLKIDLPERIANIVPFTREALQFLIVHDAITFDRSGGITVNDYKTKAISTDRESDLAIIFRRAEFFGKWLAKAGDTHSIFIFLGIKP